MRSLGMYTLCRNCYARMLGIDIAFHPLPVRQLFAALGQPDSFKIFRFTTEHEECESCSKEMVQLGYDPCLERCEFYYDIEPFGKGKHIFIRLFGFMVGFDGVSEHGNYLQFFDNKIDDLLGPDWWS